MKCRRCNADKLSKEFPPQDLTDECKHPHFYCMRCVIATCKESGTCLHPGCGHPVPSDVIELIEYTLAEMFKEYSCEYSAPLISADSCTGMIRIAVLNGDSITLPFSPVMTVIQLKKEIKAKLGHEETKQQLMYKDTELQIYDRKYRFMILADYSIQASSTIYLAVTLFDIPQNLDHVIFDLHWGYPERWYYDGSHGPQTCTLSTKAVGNRKANYTVVVPHGWCFKERHREYLDASCFVYSGKQFLEVYDFHPEHKAEATIFRNVITHTGDKMNDEKKIGHHTIEVFLQKLPAQVTHLFFTLSGWNHRDIGNFPDLTLKFFDSNVPNVDLCETKLANSVHQRAVVMCCVSRSGKGWRILESGKVSDGYAGDYGPIKDTISKLLDADIIF